MNKFLKIKSNLSDSHGFLRSKRKGKTLSVLARDAARSVMYFIETGELIAKIY